MPIRSVFIPLYLTMAVYLDDTACGITIYGNIFEKASHAVFIGGGSDNTVENNLFIDCDPSVHIDARGLGWAKDHIQKGGAWGIYKRLYAVPYNKAPYTKYKHLAEIEKHNPAIPRNNVVVRNISVGGPWLELMGLKRSQVVLRDNLVDIDPHFADPKNKDFRLKPDSPAHRLGFKPIPVEKIGLYQPLPF